MRKEDNPCYGCQARKMGCHTKCDGYHKYVVDWEAEKTVKKKYLDTFVFDSYGSDKAKRLKKFKRERRGR